MDAAEAAEAVEAAEAAEAWADLVAREASAACQVTVGSGCASNSYCAGPPRALTLALFDGKLAVLQHAIAEARERSRH